jgi:hypothetical protein
MAIGTTGIGGIVMRGVSAITDAATIITGLMCAPLIVRITTIALMPIASAYAGGECASIAEGGRNSGKSANQKRQGFDPGVFAS